MNDYLVSKAKPKVRVIFLPIFTIVFCALIVAIYILDNFFLVPKEATVSAKEKLLTGHNKGYINKLLRLSHKQIKKGEVWRLVSSCLLHIGTFHILFNTMAMFIVGYAVESSIGSVKACICYSFSTLISGLFMAFVYKLEEGEGASTGIFGMIAVFLLLALRNGTIFFSPVPVWALIVLAGYTAGGIITEKATIFEHLSGFIGGLMIGSVFVF